MSPFGSIRPPLVVLLALMMVSTQGGFTDFPAATEAQMSSDLTGISVKVLVSSGPQYGSAFALHDMFEWMNATAEYLYADEVNSTTLSGCDILAAPGGSAFTYGVMLGAGGREAIVDFVSSGGSYFGICGGAMLGTDYFLRLFDGVIRTPVPGVESGTYMIQLAVNRSCLGPDLSDQPENVTTLYWGSGYFDPENWTNIHPVTTYLDSEYSPMVAFPYENGSVFLSSPHPEYEEDDDRDGTDQFDYLDDPESEWGLLLKVACWLVDVSPSSQTETTTTTTSVTTTESATTTASGTTTAPDETHVAAIVGAAATGVVAVVAAVTLRRRH